VYQDNFADESGMKIAILTTGGTIEKTYDETDGSLRNVDSVLRKILRHLRLPSLDFEHVSILSKDSLDLTDDDRDQIAHHASAKLRSHDAVLVIHGTDTLAQTGELLVERLTDLTKPIVLTGAMRPYEFRDTDAFQNVTEALLACRILPPGVYVVMHNQALAFPGVTKDRTTMTFVRQPG
jgi:L-asparaginase